MFDDEVHITDRYPTREIDRRLTCENARAMPCTPLPTAVELVVALLSMLVILAVGASARYVGLFTPSRREVVNAIAYYIALPALVFSATAAQPLSDIVSTRLVVGVSVAMLATIAIAWLVHQRESDVGVRSVATVQSYHSNFGYLGIPVVAMSFGDLATARAGLILGVGSLIQIAATVTVLSTLTGAAASIREEVRNVLLNPVILTLLLGLSVSAAGLTVPSTPATVIERIGDTALPLALLVVGATFTVQAGTIRYRTLVTVIAVKILVMPAVALAVFLLVGADAATVRAGVVMFAMPTAVSTYVFAVELGGNRHVASLNVVATTVVSIASLLLVVELLTALT